MFKSLNLVKISAYAFIFFHPRKQIFSVLKKNYFLFFKKLLLNYKLALKIRMHGCCRNAHIKFLKFLIKIMTEPNPQNISGISQYFRQKCVKIG